MISNTVLLSRLFLWFIGTAVTLSCTLSFDVDIGIIHEKVGTCLAVTQNVLQSNPQVSSSLSTTLANVNYFVDNLYDDEDTGTQLAH